MPILFWIITSTFVVSLISLIGVIFLTLKENLINKILLILVSFSAGALIGGAFLHLIPEAIEKSIEKNISFLEIFLFLIFGFCVFFILEEFLSWHHHHSQKHSEIKSFSYLILISDGIHNFIDGLIIAGSFIISIPLGFTTTLAIIFHEIPQEIGDFGVLIYSGFKKSKALFFNFLSALFAILGGILRFLIFEKIENFSIFLLSFAAGSFIYIAASDLIPEIKTEKEKYKKIIHFFIFVLGILLMLFLKDR
ncbi:MAG: ZIP family metal transporter [Patescibacteria group bacterium]